MDTSLQKINSDEMSKSFVVLAKEKIVEISSGRISHRKEQKVRIAYDSPGGFPLPSGSY